MKASEGEVLTKWVLILVDSKAQRIRVCGWPHQYLKVMVHFALVNLEGPRIKYLRRKGYGHSMSVHRVNTSCNKLHHLPSCLRGSAPRMRAIHSYTRALANNHSVVQTFGPCFHDLNFPFHLSYIEGSASDRTMPLDLVTTQK